MDQTLLLMLMELYCQLISDSLAAVTAGYTSIQLAYIFDRSDAEADVAGISCAS